MQESRAALIVEKYALEHGKGQAFHDAVMHAMWHRGESIDDQAHLQSLAESVGLGADAVQQALNDPRYEQQVEEDMAQAYAYGLSGVPAVVFENRYLVSGAQPYDVFRQVTEKVLEENAQADES